MEIITTLLSVDIGNYLQKAKKNFHMVIVCITIILVFPMVIVSHKTERKIMEEIQLGNTTILVNIYGKQKRHWKLSLHIQSNGSLPSYNLMVVIKHFGNTQGGGH